MFFWWQEIGGREGLASLDTYPKLRQSKLWFLQIGESLKLNL
jgi:hypothetical protein